jgi:hypothetical protein
MITQIARVVTAGLQSTIIFPSIPGTYQDLVLYFKGRDTANSGELFARIQFNADNVSGNYTSTQYLAGTGSAPSAGVSFTPTANGFIMAPCPGVNGNANAMGVAVITIHDYVDTLFHKTVHSEAYEIFGAGPTQVDYVFGGVWKSTAAITQIVLTCGTTAFVNGCIATLYGMA